MHKRHLDSIDMLRGIVALLVCLYHFTEGFLPVESSFRYLFSRGYLGVEIFFVISGFVIPYTMYKSHYDLRQSGKFMLKRLARIEPPYWCSIILIFIIDYFSTFFKHYEDKVITVDYKDLFYHLLHINDFVNQAWMKGIYWSLAIEIQYYLLMALIFPLLLFNNKWISYSVLLIFCLGRWLEWNHTVFYYGCHFAFGIILFNAHIGTITSKHFWIAIALLFILTYWCFDIYHLSAVVFAVFFIKFFSLSIQPLKFLGKISYSFYLIHLQIGWSMIDACLRTYPNENRIQLILLAIPCVVIASYFFFVLIEKPSHLLARKFS
ncbi:MAG: acyltransferase [Saprospiraceae bacterium]|nr:acyltransferase [Saprospiraceae bacterium]MBK7912464.1 acyltransferase [Saprospiraceae bacterium]